MKVFEVLDDFENAPYKTDEEEQRHLFRKQAAKCHAIDLFIHQLAKKYPNWWKDVGASFWTMYPTKEWDVMIANNFNAEGKGWILPSLVSYAATQKIKQEFLSKYTAMRHAKMNFERTGARYLKFAG